MDLLIYFLAQSLIVLCIRDWYQQRDIKRLEKYLKEANERITYYQNQIDHLER